jgi:hypothetical protein
MDAPSFSGAFRLASCLTACGNAAYAAELGSYMDDIGSEASMVATIPLKGSVLTSVTRVAVTRTVCVADAEGVAAGGIGLGVGVRLLLHPADKNKSMNPTVVSVEIAFFISMLFPSASFLLP